MDQSVIPDWLNCSPTLQSTLKSFFCKLWSPGVSYGQAALPRLQLNLFNKQYSPPDSFWTQIRWVSPPICATARNYWRSNVNAGKGQTCCTSIPKHQWTPQRENSISRTSRRFLYLQVGPFCIYSLDTNRLVEVCNPSKTTTGHRIQSPPIPHSEGVIFLQHFQPH